jgi:hypothetical protein
VAAGGQPCGLRTCGGQVRRYVARAFRWGLRQIRDTYRAHSIRANRLKSAGVVLLLFAVVASTIAGAETAFFTVLTAWVLFPMLEGFRNTLDAGCAFMLISVGVVVVELARNGPGSLLT